MFAIGAEILMKPPSPQRLLKQALAEHLDWHGARLSFLAHFILALFQVRTVNLAEIAQAFSGRVKPESNYRRLQRFFQQFTIDYATVARLIVRLSPLGEGPWYLTMDRTNWKFGRRDINILVLGIAYRGIAVPVVWTLLPKAGNSNTTERIELRERFLALFGRKRIQALLADREFVGRDWLSYLQRQQTPFRIRIKQNTTIPNHWNKAIPAKRLFQSLKPGQVHHLQGRRPIWGCLVFLLALRLEDGSLLIIATTDHPEQALEDYARRWEIESLFAALKKRGFRFEETHLTEPERISRLIALLAFAFAYHTGEVLSYEQPIPFKKPLGEPLRPSSVMASISSVMSC
jgi:hypothetical protein